MQAIFTEFNGEPLPHDLLAQSVLQEGSDAFALVQIDIETSKYVKPISISAMPSTSSNDFTAGKKPFKTLTKYSYAESGKTLIKVLLPELD